MSIFIIVVNQCIDLKSARGNTMTLPITHRPQKCALCSISDGNHAMHPLYDKHGKKGQPIPTTNSKTRGTEIRMVHTLCAHVINKNEYSRNLVYGCDVEGSYTFSKSRDEDYKAPLDMSYQDDSGDSLMALVNHFVIVYDDKSLPQKDYVHCKKQLTYKQEFQKLCCTVCKKENKSRQIPIQVCKDLVVLYDMMHGRLLVALT